MELNGAAIPIEMRLKGLLNDHRDTDKWSFRIKLPREHAYDGMTGFSIQHPKTRGYLDEWTYRETMRSVGLLAPRFSFASVIFNGVPSGIYAVEEHLGSRIWLESLSRRDGIILRLDDTDLWRLRLQLGVHHGAVYPVGFANSPLHEYRANRAAENPVLRRQRDAAMRLLIEFVEGQRRGSEVFDVVRTSRFLAMQELWSSAHVLGPPNARFYFNPITARLEPIAGDAEPEFSRGPHLVSLPPYYRDRGDLLNSIFWPQLYLEDPAAMEAFIRELHDVTRPEFLEHLHEQLASEESRYLWALRREYPQVQTLWPGLKSRQAQLRAMLDVPRTVIAYGQRDAGSLTLAVGNVLGLAVEVLEIQVDGMAPIPAQEALRADHECPAILDAGDGRTSVILRRKRFDQPIEFGRFAVALPPADRPAPPAAPNRPPLPGSFRAPWIAVPEPPAQPIVRLRTRVLGSPREVIVEARVEPELLEPGDPLPPPLSISETLSRFSFIEPGEAPASLRIMPGEWTVEEDLILPAGVALLAGPGTTLRFAEHAVLIARGPIHFEGDEAHPVVLEPTGPSWPGIFITEAGAPSVLSHTVVRSARGIDRGGWFLTGGVTFYESPVAITDCRFIDNTAEDSLNTIRSAFTLRSTTFHGCLSDSIDADFCTGIIASCTFANVGGDAIDISGSEIQIHDIFAHDIGDKAISVGEDSRAEIERIRVERATFGLASKDASFAAASRMEFRDCAIGIAAFIKKPAFGPSTITARLITFSGVERHLLVQAGSLVRLDGREIEGTPVDVVAIYEAELERAAANRSRAAVPPADPATALPHEQDKGEAP